MPSEASGTGEDITITQFDTRQLQLAKGAVYSAIVMLQRVTGVENAQIRQLFLCGGFGNYINVASAMRIRMLPPLPTERVLYVGNAAHAGAEMVLLSDTARREAERLVRRIEHVSLADHPDFQNVFVEAMAI